MSLFRFKIVFLFLSFTVLISCSDDDKSTEITVATEDVTVEIYETVNEEDEIVTVPGSTNEGNVEFELVDEDVEGAFAINTDTGLLTVADASAFDFTVNPSLSAIVEVYNGDVSAQSIVKVNLIEVRIETEDITIEIYEIVEEGDELATVTGTTDQGGEVMFEIVEESVEGAFAIEAETGVLTVADASVFAYATNPTLLATVNVYSGDMSAEALVTVNLLEVLVETEDLYVEVAPFPSSGEVLGTIVGDTNVGDVSFEILSASEDNAFTIDTETGVLKVLDGALYDPNTNPVFTAEVQVSNHDITSISNVTVNVLLDCDSSIQYFEDFVDDLIANQGFSMVYTMDTETHEYTFSLSQAATICSIGYQGFKDDTPYVFEIVNQVGDVLYEDTLTFSSTTQEYVSIEPLHLESGTYTIKRTFTDWDFITDTIGHIVDIPGEDFPFPMPYNGFMTFEGSNFYGTGGPLVNWGLPYITLGFN